MDGHVARTRQAILALALFALCACHEATRPMKGGGTSSTLITDAPTRSLAFRLQWTTETEKGSMSHKKLGSATWIGSDKVLTASHLFLDVPRDAILEVGNGVEWVPAQMVKGLDPAVSDLALLRVRSDDLARLKPRAPDAALCDKPLEVGDAVRVTYMGGSGHSFAIDTYASPGDSPSVSTKTTNVVTAYLPHGSSGGAAYEIADGCLVGVVSRSNFVRGLGGTGSSGESGAEQGDRADLYNSILVPTADIHAFLDRE